MGPGEVTAITASEIDLKRIRWPTNNSSKRVLASDGEINEQSLSFMHLCTAAELEEQGTRLYYLFLLQVRHAPLFEAGLWMGWF
jgi:hypothetical protein